jgi:UDP-N-acetylglucosamine 2-epimerase (non-hydrolysing)
VRVALVVGARPNFVKIAPIMAEMQAHPSLSPTLIHTGQHYDANMSESFFKDLGIPDPDVNLGVRAESNPIQTAEIMLRLTPVLTEIRPDLVLVVGDVNSTAAGALVAAKIGIRLAHVEAGLRSFDRSMPEEINRVVADAVADLCFTTEPAANANLAREGIPPERIHHVGNVMIDTLVRSRDAAAASSILETLDLEPRGYAVLTLHRPANVDEPDALRRTLAALEPIARETPVVFPVHPRTRRHLEALAATVPGIRRLRCVEPLPYLDFLHLMASAICVATDSGGIQEETTALGVPCLTLRATTERPITVTEGTNRVVGSDPERIRAAWARIRNGDWPRGRVPDLWDGRASQRIVQVLLQ